MGGKHRTVWFGIAIVLLSAFAFFGGRAVFLILAEDKTGSALGLVRHESPIVVAPFSFVDQKGNSHDLSEWNGQIVILNLWGTWCQPCREEMPTLDRLAADLQGESIAVVSINLDHPGQIPPDIWMREAGLSNLIVYHADDAPVLEATRTKLVPTTLVLGRKGAELARLTGAINWDEKRYRMMIAYYAQ